MNQNDDGTVLERLKRLLATADDDGYPRRTIVRYAQPDGRERLLKPTPPTPGAA